MGMDPTYLQYIIQPNGTVPLRMRLFSVSWPGSFFDLDNRGGKRPPPSIDLSGGGFAFCQVPGIFQATGELAFNWRRFAKTWALPLTSKGHGEGRAERI